MIQGVLERYLPNETKKFLMPNKLKMSPKHRPPQCTSSQLLCSADQRLRHLWKGCRILYFKFANKVMQNEVSEASLHIHIQDVKGLDTASPAQGHYTINIQISKVIRHGNSRASEVIGGISVKMSREELRMGKWYKVDVTGLVAEWFRSPRENLGIIVRAEDSNDRMALMVPHSTSESSGFMPYIEVFLRDNSHKRTRRTIGMDCTESSQETRCCRYPLKVDFEEFGWDWVIAPKQYEANYCSGECPYSFFQKYPHTHIVHLAAPPGSGGPCCSPRKLSSISMLYFDHDFNIIYGTLPGMVVERCGCS